ncbi:MAG: class IV adenylate cyclase [Pirellulaceae bacterium]
MKILKESDALARNVEIKARVDRVNDLIPTVEAISDYGPEVIKQDDTFFQSAMGRLKLRQFSPTQAELIYYERADQAGPKLSFYLRTPTNDPATLRASLERSNGIIGRVVKTRILYLVGKTRIHLDRVEGLGEFLELEVVMADGDERAAGEREAQNLMDQLGITGSQLIHGRIWTCNESFFGLDSWQGREVANLPCRITWSPLERHGASRRFV